MARELLVSNPKRVNFKLCSQNHRERKQIDEGQGQIVERPAGDDEEDDPEECLATPEIKEENKTEPKRLEQKKSRLIHNSRLSSGNITQVGFFRISFFGFQMITFYLQWTIRYGHIVLFV